MRSLRPTGWCRVSVRAGPTDRLEDSPKGRQPDLLWVRPGSGTHPQLTSSPSGVVDRQRAMSILAAGSVGRDQNPRSRENRRLSVGEGSWANLPEDR